MLKDWPIAACLGARIGHGGEQSSAAPSTRSSHLERAVSTLPAYADPFYEWGVALYEL